jgi:hypothetical protein
MPILSKLREELIPWNSQPQEPVQSSKGVAWVPTCNYIDAPGIAGNLFAPTLATKVVDVPFAKNNYFTIVVVFCAPTASQPVTDIVRLGQGSTGVRLDVTTTTGGINGVLWTLNGVANGTSHVFATSPFTTYPFVSVISVSPTKFEVSTGPLGNNRSGIVEGVQGYSQTASIITPSDTSLNIKGISAKHYAIIVLPEETSQIQRESYILNPWQLFEPRRVQVPKYTYNAINPINKFNRFREVSAPWTEQPQENVEIDWNNPLSKGLVIAVLPFSNINHVDKSVLETAPGYTTVSAQKGIATSSEYIRWPEPASASADGSQYDLAELTAFVFGYQTSTQNVASAFSRAQGSSGANSWGIGLHGGSNNGAYCQFGGITLQPAATYANVTTPTTALMTAGVSSGIKLYVNGKLQQTGSYVAPTYQYSPGTERRVVFGSKTGPGVATTNRMFLGLFWNRVLQDDEVASISNNPWQLFEPRRIQVPKYSFAPPNPPKYRRELLVARTTQPQEVTQLDWSNPLTKDMTMCLVGLPGHERDLINPFLEINKDLSANVGTCELGVGVGLSGTAYGLSTDRNPGGKVQSAGMNHSLFFVGSVVPASGQRVLCGTSQTNFGGINIIQWGTGASLDILVNIRTDTGSNAFDFPDPSGIGLGTGVHGTTLNGATARLYKNGVKLREVSNISGSTVVYDTTFGRATLLGSNASDTSIGVNGVGLMAVAWNRTLTDEEVARFTANPWQIFEPHHVLLPQYKTLPKAIIKVRNLQKKINDSQPHGSISIDRANTLTIGLSALVSSIDAELFEHTTSQRFIGSGSSIISVPSKYHNAPGKLISSASSRRTLLNPTNADLISGANPFSILCEFNPTDGQLSPLIISSEAVAENGFGLYQDDYSTGYNTTALTVGGSIVGPGLSGALENNFEQYSHRVIITYDGTDIRTYVNGRLSRITPISLNIIFNNNRRLSVGGNFSGTLSTNAISLAAIWSRTLSTTEVLEVYTNPWQLFEAPSEFVPEYGNELVHDIPTLKDLSVVSFTSSTARLRVNLDFSY